MIRKILFIVLSFLMVSELIPIQTGKTPFMNVFKFLLFISLFSFFSCSLPALSVQKQSITQNIIKTHGFYYNKPDYWSFMIYQNGVFRGDFGVDEKNIESVIRSFTDSNYTRDDYKIPYAWGLFEIKNNTINIERWRSGEWAAYGKTKYSGILLNDSTLLVDHPVVGKDTFYFYYFPVKPDSTNKFIK